MKRLLIGISLTGFLIFAGLQASHLHAKSPAGNCQICLLSGQTQHPAAASPTLTQPVRWVQISTKPEAKILAYHYSLASARAPPEA